MLPAPLATCHWPAWPRSRRRPRVAPLERGCGFEGRTARQPRSGRPPGTPASAASPGVSGGPPAARFPDLRPLGNRHRRRVRRDPAPTRGDRRAARPVDVRADARPRGPVAAARRLGGRPAAEGPPCTVPAEPPWLLSIPDGDRHLEHLNRTLLTRRDIERLFGVSKARAATLGPSSSANQRRSRARRSLQQLKEHFGRAAFRVEEERRARLVAELQQARLAGSGSRCPPTP